MREQRPTIRPDLELWMEHRPWSSDFDVSKNLSRSSSTFLPTPEHSGHIPSGSLKEKAFEYPTNGSPTRENRSLSIG